MNILKGFFLHENIFSKLILTTLFSLIGLLASYVLAIVFILIYFQTPFSELPTLLEQNINTLKVLQFAQSIGLFLLPTIVMIHLSSLNKKTTFLQLNKKPKTDLLIGVFLSMTIAIPLINWMMEINATISFPEALSSLETWMQEKEALAKKLTERFLETQSGKGLLTNIFLMAIVPAICEELFFRGLLQSYFQQWTKNSHASIWITAIIFSAIHFQFYGFVPRMLLGAFFGYLLVWSKNMWLPIAAHFTNNALAVIFFFLYQHHYIDVNPDTIGTSGNYIIVILSAFSFLGFIFYIRKRKN